MKSAAVPSYLYVPESYLEASPEMREKYANGCGPDGWKIDLSPIAFVLGLGFRIRPSCLVHDWQYAEGRTIDKKNRADRVFLNNLIRIASHGRWLRRWRKLIALGCYALVVVFGGPPFWDGDKIPD